MVAALILITALSTYGAATQVNPHGAGFDLDCTLCHSTEAWTPVLDNGGFDHGTTGFSLEGRHDQVNCDFCHESLEFRQVEQECSSCHLDVHEGQFGDFCERCHSPEGWIDDAGFRRMHQSTRFALTGPHAGPDCAACHADGRYAGISTECASCHLDSYLEADSPDHTGYSTDCEQCHGLVSTEWPGSVVNFAHTNEFPLVGGHAGTSCNACHPAGEEYGTIDAACVACHQADYIGADDPDHVASQFPTECAQCHNVYDWDDADNFDHSSTGFPLLGEHGEASCNECHATGYTGTPTACIACHQEDYNEADDHVSDGYPTDCTICHTSFDDWEDGVNEDFDHDGDTRFPLTGAHENTDCGLCHIGGQTQGLPLDCVGCHEDDAAQSAEVDHAGFPADCTQCHSTLEWTGATFDHDQSDFPLTGAHGSTDCTECHGDGVYDGLDTACLACHGTDRDEAAEPVHSAGSFDDDCTVCHTTDAWTPGTFDHDTQTDFLVEGAHQELTCAECHLDAVYDGTPLECFGCHETDYNETEDPDHAGGGYATTCLDCHNQDDWEDVDDGDFDHSAVSEFALLGGHAGPACTDCHADGYAVTEAACASCHQADFDSAADPPHQAGAFDADCATCHDIDAWVPSSFDHDSQTAFVLDGEHLGEDCAECHVSGDYLGTPETCYGCHQADYEDTDDPDHVAEQYPTDCTECHSTSDWDSANFNHDNTAFPLSGAHATTDCALCHTSGYSGTPQECIACHEDDYNQTVDPDHGVNSYPSQCTQCHGYDDWVSVSGFEHNTWTAYNLTGEHVNADCGLCHTDGYSGTPTDCIACHLADAENADDPVHAAQFGTDCSVCHTTMGWSPSSFSHQNFTGYPLSGAHIFLDCAACHAAGDYDNTPDACIGCHQDDYDNAGFDHTAPGFDDQCQNCHGNVGWTPSTYDHGGDTGFPIEGAHFLLDCSDCHIDNQYDNTPGDCIFCHQDDWNGTSDPDHEDAGFPTDCSVCHNFVIWGDADFNHDPWFPIYSGEHNNEWDSCEDCHTTGQFPDFTCAVCHETDDMDDEHSGIGGYSNDPQACLACHPDGDDGPFLTPELIREPSRKEPR